MLLNGMSHYGFSCLLASIVSLILSIFIYLKSRKKILNILWALFELSIFIWCFSQFVESFIQIKKNALLWNKILLLGVIYIPIFFLHATIVFIEYRTKQKYVIRIVYILGIVFSGLVFTDLLINDVVLKPLFGYYTSPGPLYYYFFAFFGLTVFYAFYINFSAYKFLPILKKQQLKYILIGSAIGFISGTFNFLPAFDVPTSPFINYIFIIAHLPIVYGIIRYRVLDISVVFTRTGIFIATYSMVLGIPFFLAFGCQQGLLQLFGFNWWIVPLVSSTILATVGPFIYLYIQRKAEDKLLKEQKSYQNILRNASSGMIRIKNLNKLLNVVVHVVTKTVRIKHASIFLFDKETNHYVLYALRGRQKCNYSVIDPGSPLVWQLNFKKKPIVTEEIVMRLRDEVNNQSMLKFVDQLKGLDASLVIPSFVENRLIGILLLGEKKSGKLYSEDDLVVFSVLANQAALAIENAQFYDEIKQTHEQLFQAEKMATIGTMADGLSHQINNRFHALSLISGDALDIIKTFDQSNCNEDVRQVFSDLRASLERIEANVLQGGEVVKGLLKYSRPGEGGFEQIDFKDVVQGAIDMVQYKIKLKEVDLIQNIPAELPRLHGNLTQLQEVFFNLIDNAYDATKERQSALKEDGFRSRIEITASCVDGFAEISISDNGMGVKDLDKKKLFTPFFTTKATAKKGTGLGLYVIDKIVATHSGKISIESEYKSGTRFTITLPISQKAI